MSILRRFRWSLAACAVGAASSFLFSALLHWPRATFVGAHSALVLALMVVYARTESVNFAVQFSRRWVAGMVGGLVVGALLIQQVMGQPSSPSPEGFAPLATALGWYGVVYGAADALLLTVLPVLTVYGSGAADALSSARSRFRVAGLSLLASAIITAVYHLGFSEFRGASLLAPVLGNLLITLAYLLTGSPVAALVSHIMMHIAAVLHGSATTLQLPPHY
ncbi:MAG: hypothetical protein U0132_01630 [Gemmatimonadaceae bacterium]